jgi:glucose-1-phosphate cytidylyltransferase
LKVVILAGGYGTRLAELTDNIPKPMAEIGSMPILLHIIKIYEAFGFSDFIIALGYKGDVILNYFSNLAKITNDIKLLINDDLIFSPIGTSKKINIQLVETGKDTMTGGRIKKLQPYLNEVFMLTYGDGVADIDINALINFHKASKGLITISAVNPKSKYGKLEIDDNGIVKKFVEKPEFTNEWINGGFMVIEPKFLEFIDGDQTILEREPLEAVCSKFLLSAYKHYGFWHCMDTLRDKKDLEGMWNSSNPPWKVWK